MTTGQQRPLGGITGKGFMPGRSGNPAGNAGKQKGLAAMIRARTREGRRLVELMWQIAEGNPFRLSVTITGQVIEVEKRPSIHDRMDAIRWLADRGWGKAREIITLDEEGGGRRAPMLVFLGADDDPLAPEAPSARRVIQAESAVIDVTPPKKTARPSVPLPEVAFEMDDPEWPQARAQRG